VATVALDGERIGLTLSSFVALSLDPPLVGFAVSRQAALHELLREAGAFGLSLLTGDQEELAQHFARGVPPIALWENVAVREGALGAPLLASALGWIEGRVQGEVEAGTHTFFLGGVERVERGQPLTALVHLGQAYRWLPL
jgi:flavin reductase (DIM6/NTAB) family NADH-FMN oxidoreductase RutF